MDSFSIDRAALDPATRGLGFESVFSKVPTEKLEEAIKNAPVRTPEQIQEDRKAFKKATKHGVNVVV